MYINAIMYMSSSICKCIISIYIYIYICIPLSNKIYNFTIKVLLRLRNGPVSGIVPSLDTPPAVQAKVVFVTYEKKPMNANIPFSLFGGKFLLDYVYIRKCCIHVIWTYIYINTYIDIYIHTENIYKIDECKYSVFSLWW
jgi:hypothetical protein